MRPSAAALSLAVLVTGALPRAVCAQAQAAVSFEEVTLHPPRPTSHRLAWCAATAGVALVAGSFPLAAEADRRYSRYLREGDPAAIEARYAATVRMDHLASASLLTGEGLLLTGLWLRFVRRPAAAHVSWGVEPGRCAVSLRF